MRLLVDDDLRRFLVPDDTVLNPGPLKVDCFTGVQLTVREEEVLPFLCTEDEAAEWMAAKTNQELEDFVFPAIEALASVFSGRKTRLHDLLKDKRMSQSRVLAGLGRAGADPASFDEDFEQAAEAAQDPFIKKLLQDTPAALKAALHKGPPVDEDEG